MRVDFSEFRVNASDNSRVYQVAQGNMYIGVSGAAQAGEYAALPILEAARRLSDMPTEEAVTIIVALDAQSAARRLEAMDPERAIDVLDNMDEVAAVVRLGCMSGSGAARLLSIMPEATAKYFISAFPSELIERVVGTEYLLDILPLVSSEVTEENLYETAAKVIRLNDPQVIANFLQAMPDDRWINVWRNLGFEKKEECFKLMLRHFWPTVNALPPEQAAEICFEAGKWPEVLQFICNLSESSAVMSWYWFHMEHRRDAQSFMLALDLMGNGPLLGDVLGNLSTAQAARVLEIAFSHPRDAPHVAEWRALRVGFTLGRFPEHEARQMCSALPKKYAKKAWAHRTNYMNMNR
ncbi:hypothetical protein ABZ485_25085 [Streptomyces albogriseolus]|uniref:magnesium transporter MgtE N-terminal domain-containing protein n=1 Tax=Streptomyces albogriseolus TaxID=1887 RepID=UPI00345F295A